MKKVSFWWEGIFMHFYDTSVPIVQENQKTWHPFVRGGQKLIWKRMREKHEYALMVDTWYKVIKDGNGASSL